MKISTALPTGVAALLFDSARQRRAAEVRLVDLLEGAGYAEAILPILDYMEPYEALLAPASRGELYRFIDRDGEQLALRSDFTPLLARLIAPRLNTLPLPLRLYYRGDVIRYKEARAGQQRELYQMGAELLGLPGDQAEREVLRLFLEALEAGGGAEVQVVLGFAGALDQLLLEAGEEGKAALAQAVSRRERNAVRKDYPRLRAVVENGVPDRPEDLGPDAADRLVRLFALRDELAALFPAAQLSIDLAELSLVRAGERSYYDGIIFRAYAGTAALPVGGGGRYDTLFHQLGARVPALGFSLSLERLLEVRR